MPRPTNDPYYQDQYSNGDPRGYLMNESAYQKQRYEDQQGPLANAIAMNYGRATEANYGDYTDIMNNYRGIASGDMYGGDGGGGGYDDGGVGGGGGGYSAFTVSPGRAGYSDPFESYAGFKDFSTTGGYSAEDLANMRARGVAPIRAAYENAERNMGQQRALQGGYSPNAIAAQVKMAREQGQGMADANTNLEAQLAQMKQSGRLQGLTGMSGIEGQRLSADVDVSKFNTGLDFQGQTYNADAQARAQAQNLQASEAAASRRAQSSAARAAQSSDDRFRALSGMTNLYGTTPGMSNMFGNQAISITGQGGAQGNAFYGSDINAQARPGQFDQTMGRAADVADVVGKYAAPVLDYFAGRKKNQQQQTPTPTNYRMPTGQNTSWFQR